MDPGSWQIQRTVSAALNAIKQNSLIKNSDANWLIKCSCIICSLIIFGQVQYE